MVGQCLLRYAALHKHLTFPGDTSLSKKGCYFERFHMFLFKNRLGMTLFFDDVALPIIYGIGAKS